MTITVADIEKLVNSTDFKRACKMREYHIVFADGVEVIAWFAPRTPDNPTAPGIPATVRFRADYIADITDCPTVKVVKCRHADPAVAKPLPFIAADQVGDSWFIDRGMMRKFDVFENPCNEIELPAPKNSLINFTFDLKKYEKFMFDDLKIVNTL